MMSIERHDPAGLSAPRGYSHVVRVGALAFIAGQIARGPDGEVVGIGDARAQARQVFANLATALAAVGATLDDVVRTTTFVVRREYIEDVFAVRMELFGHGTPANTAVVVASLARPEYLVEIDAIAALPT